MPGIMMSISTTSIVRHASEHGDGVGSAVGDDDVRLAAHEQRGHRVDVAEVVVDQEDLRRRPSAPAATPFGRCGRATSADGRRDRRSRRSGAAGRSAAGAGRRRRARGVRSWPIRREEDGEVLPAPGRAGDGDLAAEQADELAADREPEPGAAVEAGGGAVALRERFEDPQLLLVVDADAGVARPRTRRRTARLERLGRRAPSVVGGADVDGHLAALGELERVGEQVLQDLAQALRVGDDRRGAVGRELDRVLEALAWRDGLELAEQAGAQLADRELAHLDGDRARLGLREIEDAVEQLEQLVARRVDDARVLDLRVGHVAGRGCPRAAGRGSGGCSAGSAARGSCSR